jgi:DNA-binding PadR family transcriptional regulator
MANTSKTSNPHDLASIHEIILSSLYTERYGTEIIQNIRRASDYTRTISNSSLYPELKRLEEWGFVSSREGELANRIYYEITEKGKEALEIKNSFIFKLK